jgi:PAS domain S-box-containing protein
MSLPKPTSDPPTRAERRGQFATQDEELRYKDAALAHSTDAISINDLEGGCRYANDAWLALWGFSRSQVLGRSVRDIWPDEPIGRLLGAPDPTERAQAEIDAPRCDGRRILVRLSVTPVRDDASDPVGFLVSATDVTAQRAAEAELKLKDAAIAVAANGVAITDLEGRFHYVNHAFVRLCGYSAEEMVGTPVVEFFGEYAEPTMAAIWRDGHWAGEDRLRRKDGMVIPIHLTASVIRDASGQPAGMLASFVDLSDLKRAEAELRLKEAAIAASSNAIAIADADRRVIYLNDAHVRMFGYRREDVIGKYVLEAFPDVAAVLRGANADGTFNGEHPRLCRDGSTIWVRTSASPVLDASGAQVATISVMVDVTEGRRVQDELAFQNALLSTQQEVSIDGILVVGKAGEILSYNRRFVDIWGIPPDVVESRSDERALQSVLDKLADPEGFLAKVKYLYEHTDESSREEVILRDGRTLDRYSAPMLRADGTYLGRIWYFRDITSRVQAEQALARRTVELERSNRELEQFAYVASHDLQEPLRMVASYTQLLAKRYQDKLDDDAHDFIEYAVSGANRMQRLINDLLAYSRVGTRGKQPTPVDAHSALGRAVANLAIAIETSQGMVTNGELPVVNVDEAQLVQVFQHLIENALKFRRDLPPIVHVSAERAANEWVFAVRDNGEGIAADFLPRLFQIFQRLHSKQVPGTGIGLALCKRIVERHGGTVWVESEPGQGSTFCFTLPA